MFRYITRVLVHQYPSPASPPLWSPPLPPQHLVMQLILIRNILAANSYRLSISWIITWNDISTIYQFLQCTIVQSKFVSHSYTTVVYVARHIILSHIVPIAFLSHNVSTMHCFCCLVFLPGSIPIIQCSYQVVVSMFVFEHLDHVVDAGLVGRLLTIKWEQDSWKRHHSTQFTKGPGKETERLWNHPPATISDH